MLFSSEYAIPDGGGRDCGKTLEEDKKVIANIHVELQKEVLCASHADMKSDSQMFEQKPSSIIASSHKAQPHKSGSILEEFIRSASSSDGNGMIRSPMLLRDRDEDAFKRGDGRTPKYSSSGGKSTSPYRLDDLMGGNDKAIRSAINEEDSSTGPTSMGRDFLDSERLYRRETSSKLSSESIGILPFSRSPSAGFCEKLSSSMEPEIPAHVRTMVSPRRTVSPRRGERNDRYQERSDEPDTSSGIMPFDRSLSSGSQGEGVIGKNDALRRAPTSSSGLSRCRMNA
eukprot:753216-Hanusia_phi.AAC.3